QLCIYNFFFSSSRRQYTIFSRDWSSDVCSSDLRTPAGGAVPLVDLLGDPLHLGGVVAVHGEVLAGGVGEGDVHDPLAPVGVVVEELSVGEQTAHDVLRQLGAVHADDRAARGAAIGRAHV